MDKKRILLILIAVVSGLIVYQVFLKKEEQKFELVGVIRGNIYQEVIETGQVQKGEKINLTFKNSGRIESVFVEVGKEVGKGDILAKLETEDVQIQLQEAKAVLSLAEAKLGKLLAGPNQEEIKIAQTKIENNQISLSAAEQDLEDAYDNSINVLDDAYLKAYNAQNFIDYIQRTYFTANDQDGFTVKEKRKEIETSVLKIKSSLDSAKADLTQANIDSALSETKNELSNISNCLKTVREICESPAYRNLILAADKTSLDTHRSNINTVLTAVTNSRQLITSARLSMESSNGQLRIAQEELLSLTALPRQEDVNLYQSEVDQAKAKIQALENKIQENYLRSPTDGQITEIKKRIGELVQSVPQDVVITLLPVSPYEIEVDIYEEDVVKIKIDNEVEISLVAFPNQVFKGKVISIDPAEKIIDGVVYYKVIINFESFPEEIKPGMTADLTIKTMFKENVLIVPEDAVQKKNNQTIVRVFSQEKIDEKQVEVGLEGKDGMLEIISGLEGGEKLILE